MLPQNSFQLCNNAESQIPKLRVKKKKLYTFYINEAIDRPFLSTIKTVCVYLLFTFKQLNQTLVTHFYKQPKRVQTRSCRGCFAQQTRYLL